MDSWVWPACKEQCRKEDVYFTRTSWTEYWRQLYFRRLDSVYNSRQKFNSCMLKTEEYENAPRSDRFLRFLRVGRLLLRYLMEKLNKFTSIFCWTNYHWPIIMIMIAMMSTVLHIHTGWFGQYVTCTVISQRPAYNKCIASNSPTAFNLHTNQLSSIFDKVAELFLQHWSQCNISEWIIARFKQRISRVAWGRRGGPSWQVFGRNQFIQYWSSSM